MVKRHLKPSFSRSFFLFGPRSTGKTTALRQWFKDKDHLFIDLLNPDDERRYSKNPELLKGLIDSSQPNWVIIDEIQKCPGLLSIAQMSIQKKICKFALTGSSARKLKRGAANLLGGRATTYELFPLSVGELEETFDLQTAIHFGLLPEIYDLDDADRIRFLKSYCTTYLKEEVVAEQLVRKVQPFRDFLELLALQNGQIVNYSKFSRDCGVDVTTIQTYLEILEDTLIGFQLKPYNTAARSRVRKNPKFYFFDTGVTRALAGHLESAIIPSTPLFGHYFESLVINEIRKKLSYQERQYKMSYLMTPSGLEIDLILELGKERIALEIKSSQEVDPIRVRSFESLAKDIKASQLVYLSRCPDAIKLGAVECMPWVHFLNNLGT